MQIVDVPATWCLGRGQNRNAGGRSPQFMFSIAYQTSHTHPSLNMHGNDIIHMERRRNWRPKALLDDYSLRLRSVRNRWGSIHEVGRRKYSFVGGWSWRGKKYEALGGVTFGCYVNGTTYASRHCATWAGGLFNAVSLS